MLITTRATLRWITICILNRGRCGKPHCPAPRHMPKPFYGSPQMVCENGHREMVCGGDDGQIRGPIVNMYKARCDAKHI